MNILSPIAHRILTRHLDQTEPLHAHEERISVIPTDAGVVTASECMRLLAPKHGPLSGFKFHGGTDSPPNTVAFAAITEEGELLSGRVEIHARSTERVVFMRAEIVVSPK